MKIQAELHFHLYTNGKRAHASNHHTYRNVRRTPQKATSVSEKITNHESTNSNTRELGTTIF